MGVAQDRAEAAGFGHGLTDTERGAVYAWLSGLLAREPSVAVLHAYRSAEGRLFVAETAGIQALGPLARAMTDTILEAPEDRLRSVSLDLSGTYARLFLGVGGRRSAPPFRSFYHGARGRLMQEPSAEMLAVLRDLDSRQSEAFNEPPDHLAIQLGVMAQLVAAGRRDRQTRFLHDQLLSWTGPFRDRCVAADPEGFYAATAMSLAAFLEADAICLSDRGT
jgi:TorA-specific chaperone